MKKNFIFDVDGTLLNTESMYMKSLQVTLEAHDIHKTYAEVYSIFGLPSLDALEFFGIVDAQKMQKEWQSHYHDFWNEVDLFAGIETILDHLHNQPDVQLGIVTSNTKQEFEDHLDQFNIEKYFNSFTFAGETAQMKPFPDPILRAMELLNAIPDESIYIGDSVHDMYAAHAAGLDFGLAAWGIQDVNKFNDDQEYTFKKPSDILHLLK
ncbi:HAD family hydrolase [Periweissella cryptocerci]|uniref:HAD family hydrolase n=1 Tax=Periweissella cryptocerci TaxID=2506420 RepID=A0A4P6YWW6_9LACO|nr:HAD family hydrolase [Periweissella cryptocerci]QBO37338.1 HAD family hydrolase [Periweissella cryptocerci]